MAHLRGNLGRVVFISMGGNEMTQTLKRLAVLTLSALTLVFVAVPVAMAGEDEDDQPRRHQTSGGSDSGSASGGAQTGFGGMAATDNGTGALTIALATGGLLVLTGAGLVARRREMASVDA